MEAAVIFSCTYGVNLQIKWLYFWTALSTCDSISSLHLLFVMLRIFLAPATTGRLPRARHGLLQPSGILRHQ